MTFAPKVCHQPGCPNLQPCDQHKQKHTSGRAMPKDWPKLRARIVRRDHGICHWCKRRGATSADHLVPVSKGGTDDDTNLVCSCWPCNLKRGNRAAMSTATAS